MKLNLATLSIGLAAVAAAPAPTQVDNDGKKFVSVSVIDEVTYPHLPGIYKHGAIPRDATWLTEPTVTVTSTSTKTVTTSVATATTTKFVTRPCDDFI